jgi:hypothetical protein
VPIIAAIAIAIVIVIVIAVIFAIFVVEAVAILVDELLLAVTVGASLAVAGVLLIFAHPLPFCAANVRLNEEILRNFIVPLPILSTFPADAQLWTLRRADNGAEWPADVAILGATIGATFIVPVRRSEEILRILFAPILPAIQCVVLHGVLW